MLARLLFSLPVLFLLPVFHQVMDPKWKNSMLTSVFLSSFVSLRRMKTPLRVGGQDVYPGASLPECRVRTVEVSFDPETKDHQTLQHLVSAAVRFMYTPIDLSNQDDGGSKEGQSKAERTRRRKLLREIKEALNIRRGQDGSIAMAQTHKHNYIHDYICINIEIFVILQGISYV